MGRFIVFLLGVAVIFGIAYYLVRGATPVTPEVSAPKRTLDNVHQAADRIQQQMQQRADQPMPSENQ